MAKSTIRALTRACVAVGTAFALLSAASAAQADSHLAFRESDLVSDQPGHATITDPDVVNAWGLALSATSPLWVANNGTNTSTLYAGGSADAVTKVGLTVSIPGGAPTGQAFNPTNGFVVTGPSGSGPARFLFVSEGGDLTGWNSTADRTNAILAKHIDGAVYKGLALWTNPFGTFLIATDFVGGHLDIFDSNFNRLTLPPNFFRDRALPSGYAPFNVMAIGDTVYVSYAKQQAGSADEQAGAGLGFVDKFTNLGQNVDRIASHGTLNAPWGLAIAPDNFGPFAGDLLVGNFGDGRISAYRGSHFKGLLRDAHNAPMVIDGLWALLPGTASTGGTGSLWFSAGPDDEQHGLVGLITPVTS